MREFGRSMRQFFDWQRKSFTGRVEVIPAKDRGAILVYEPGLFDRCESAVRGVHMGFIDGIKMHGDFSLVADAVRSLNGLNGREVESLEEGLKQLDAGRSVIVASEMGLIAEHRPEEVNVELLVVGGDKTVVRQNMDTLLQSNSFWPRRMGAKRWLYVSRTLDVLGKDISVNKKQ